MGGGNPFWAWEEEVEVSGGLALQRLLWLLFASSPVHPVQDKKTTLVCSGLAWSQALGWLLCSWLCPRVAPVALQVSVCLGSYFSLEHPQPAVMIVVGNTE